MHTCIHICILTCVYIYTHMWGIEKKRNGGREKESKRKSPETHGDVCHTVMCHSGLNIWIYICTHIYVCIHTHTCMHTYISSCIHIQVYSSPYIPKPYTPRWTLKKEPKRRETARERARPTSTNIGLPVPCLLRRQPRPPAAVPARCSCVPSGRKREEESFCAVAEEGSGVSHAALGRAHMRTSLDMYTLCAHECFEHGYIFVHIKVYIYTHTYICMHIKKKSQRGERQQESERSDINERRAPRTLFLASTAAPACSSVSTVFVCPLKAEA